MRALLLSGGLALLAQCLQLSQTKHWFDAFPDGLLLFMWVASIAPIAYWAITHDKLGRQRAWYLTQLREHREKTLAGSSVVLLILMRSTYSVGLAVWQKLQVTPDQHIDRSLAFFNQGDFERALTEAIEAKTVRPDSPFAWNNMAAAYNAQKRWKEGEGAAKETVRLWPDFQKARNNLLWAQYNMARLGGKSPTSTGTPESHSDLFSLPSVPFESVVPSTENSDFRRPIDPSTLTVHDLFVRDEMDDGSKQSCSTLRANSAVTGQDVIPAICIVEPPEVSSRTGKVKIVKFYLPFWPDTGSLASALGPPYLSAITGSIGRMYIYHETALTDQQVDEIKRFYSLNGIVVELRGPSFLEMRKLHADK